MSFKLLKQPYHKLLWELLVMSTTVLFLLYLTESRGNRSKPEGFFKFPRCKHETVSKSGRPKKTLSFVRWLYNKIPKHKSFTEEELIDFLMTDCNSDLGDISVVINRNCSKTNLPIHKYKSELAKNYTLAYSNPPKKSKTFGKISSRKDFKELRRTGYLHHASEQINVASLENKLRKNKKWRLSKGDDDPLKFPEVMKELSSSIYAVPNIVHFIWFGSEQRFRVQHYISVISVLRFQRPKAILFHHDAPPLGEYWEEIQQRAGSVLKMVKRTPPTSIFGRPINLIEHQADVVRLQIMMEMGGIYVDTDSVFLKSVNTFRKHKMVLAESEPGALANGIMMAKHSSWFLRRWYHEYKYFRENEFGFNSVVVPWAISQFFPKEIHVVKQKMCRPSWSEIDLIFRSNIDWSPIYVMHLYSRAMKTKDGMEERPLKQLAVLNTTYGEVARHAIWGDKRIRNVTDWIVTCDLTKALTMG